MQKPRRLCGPLGCGDASKAEANEAMHLLINAQRLQAEIMPQLCSPVPGEQSVDFVDWVMAILREHVGQIGMRVAVVHLAVL